MQEKLIKELLGAIDNNIEFKNINKKKVPIIRLELIIDEIQKIKNFLLFKKELNDDAHNDK